MCEKEKTGVLEFFVKKYGVSKCFQNVFFKHYFFSGLIGRAWSMLFASVGYKVMLYDILPEQTSVALEEIENELHALHSKSALRGKLSPAEQFECISATTDIRELVSNAIYLQECIPERIEMKRALYTQLAGIVEPQTIMASSTSTYMPSLFSEQMPQHRENVCLNTKKVSIINY